MSTSGDTATVEHVDAHEEKVTGKRKHEDEEKEGPSPAKVAKTGTHESVDVLDNPAHKKQEDFRNYKDSAEQKRVENFYKTQHTNQTFEFVKEMEKKYSKFEYAEMGIWEALEYLDTFVDESDPDTNNSQLQHALQTAEAIRKAYPGEEYDWLHLTALIHDLGKFMSLKLGEPQWAVVGDTFPVGCAFSDKCIFSQYFDLNPDRKHETYSTENGIYKPHCGLANVTMAWGHDEYLYRVCLKNGSTLPKSALYVIRFHSFYPWHSAGAYTHLTNEDDEKELKWVRLFQKFDLYSKAQELVDVEATKPYYIKCIQKYFPEKLKW